MDTFRSKSRKEENTKTKFAYTPPDKSNNRSFGLSLLKALKIGRATTKTEPAQVVKVAEQVNLVQTPPSYIEATPVYKGQYKNLSPLAFDTSPVDNVKNTRLERNKLATYTGSQLFLLLRLERFLRLRYHWQSACPRQDEAWKTELVKHSIFTALEDCIENGIGQDARLLIVQWS